MQQQSDVKVTGEASLEKASVFSRGGWATDEHLVFNVQASV